MGTCWCIRVRELRRPVETMVLTVLYSPDGVGLGAASTPTVDIVFVHGLNGDAIESWTDPDTKSFWPKDFLPNDTPEARVMTFGYMPMLHLAIQPRILWIMPKICLVA